MKTNSKIAIRKMRAHIPQLFGLVLLLIVGVAFFITLFTIVLRFEETAEQYFIDNAYADITFYGVFNNESAEMLLMQNGVQSAQRRTVRDFREGELIFRTISLTDSINLPYIYDGRLPKNENECIILRRNTTAMGLSTGDYIMLGDKEVVITGLAASPEYIYMVQNERTIMAQASRFGVVYVTREFFADGFNEIVVLADNNILVNDLSELIGAFRAISQKDQMNYYLYRSDLDEISSFAYIFPFVFAVLIAVVIYVMLTRIIQNDRKQIGTMKALGISDRKIIGIYLSQFCISALIGAILGGVAAMFICDFIIDVFSSMFEVPALSFALFPALWLVAVLVSTMLCAVSGMIALTRILPLMPAHAMRPRLPKGGRKILLERIGFIWKRATFNTRYALKNSFRNKSRFFAIVLGMTGSCALLSFSLGFYDSVGNTQDGYFNDFANYDMIISFDPFPLNIEHPALKMTGESYKVLMMHVDIGDEHYNLAVVEKGFDMVNIPVDELQNGVIIPEYFAGQWKVNVGDTLKISGYNAVISAIVPQYLGLTLYTSFDYLITITDELPLAYNTIYVRTENIAAVGDYLKENAIDFSTIYDDKTSFDTIMESMTVLIWFMIACSVILGFTVLYSVGLINLSAREYEYMFMGVMGYPHKSILTAHIKETILQLLIAIPLGFISGNLLLEVIKGEFSGSNFVISATIFPRSYVISALVVVGVTAIMALITSRHIDKLDIVEGLKAQDDC